MQTSLSEICLEKKKVDLDRKDHMVAGIRAIE